MNKDKIKDNLSGISNCYSLAIIDTMIRDLKDIKFGIKNKKTFISKKNWNDFKVGYETLYKIHIDDFFNNY